MIPILVSQREILHRSLDPLPRAHLVNLWNGIPAASSISYCLVVDSHSLHIDVAFPPTVPRRGGVSGDFIEGLWNQDVFELFLGISGSSSYQEIHLSPSGEWWSCNFSAPRVRLKGSPPSVTCFSQDTPSGPHARMQIPFSCQDLGTLTVNVCAALASTKELLSAVRFQGDKADFHAPSKFIPVLALQLSPPP